jgi:hypothetical protein
MGPALGLSCRCPPGMRMVLIVSLRCSHFSCFGHGSRKQCHDDRSRASLVPITRRCPVVASAMEVPGAGGAPQGATGAKVADAGPQPSDYAKSLLQDLVVRGAGADVPRIAALGDVASAPGSSSTVSPGVSGPYLPGSPGALLPPINWRRVEDEAESACS